MQERLLRALIARLISVPRCAGEAPMDEERKRVACHPGDDHLVIAAYINDRVAAGETVLGIVREPLTILELARDGERWVYRPRRVESGETLRRSYRRAMDYLEPLASIDERGPGAEACPELAAALLAKHKERYLREQVGILRAQNLKAGRPRKKSGRVAPRKK